jgi:hypothetical protein
MAKTPFEKVRSLVERKKLFEALLREQQNEILCKGEDDSLFHLKPTSIIGDQSIQGWMQAIENLPVKDTEILGNFAIGTERYFFHTTMKIKGEDASFPLSADVFRLQRRSSLRLPLNPDYEMYMAITEFQGRSVYFIAQMADLSAGGTRIFFSDVDAPLQATNSKSLNLKVNDTFKGILHLGKKKSLEVQCLVKHTRQAVNRGAVVEHFGIEFVELSVAVKNRLLALTMDLQKRMSVED